MGNQLIPNTNVNKELRGNSGVNHQWQMYHGVRTDKTKEEVTVFLFDKKPISKMPSGKEEFLNVLKREPEILGKFQHSGILKLMDPLIEDPKRIAYTTERVVSSLSNLIEGNNVSEIAYSDLDLKLHILNLAETLSYLHREVRAAHLSISPENIYIMPDGSWKLGGFSFSTQLINGDVGESKADFTQKPGQLKLTPSLRFTAPEVTRTPSLCSLTSDMFSLGCLIYALYKIKNDNGTHDPYLIQANSLHGYLEAIQTLDRNDFFHIPEEIRSTIIGMLHINPGSRMTSTDFVNHVWFKDPFIQTVKTLESIHQRDFTQQQNFLKGLCMIILKFEPSFIRRRIIPVINNLLKNTQFAPSIFSIYFKIMEPQEQPILTREQFTQLIWPSIRTIVTGKEISAQALFILMQHMELFVNYLEIKEIETVFVPLLIKSFECGVQKLQDLALKQSLFIFDKIDYQVLKSQILPKILTLTIDNNIDLRKGAILMLSKTFHVFDNNVITLHILPTLEKLQKMNNNYTINMAMLTIYQGITKDIGIDIIANKILISLIPMLVAQNHSKPEYRAFLSTIYSYLKKIEDEQNQRYAGAPDQIPEDTNSNDKLFNSQMQLQTGSQEEPQFTGDFGFLNATTTNTPNTKSSMNPNPSFSTSSKVPEVNMDDFQDWNSRPGSSKIKSNQNSQNQKDFNLDWSSFPSSNTSINPATQMDFTKNNSFNNSTNLTQSLSQSNLNSSAKNPFASSFQVPNQNFNQQSINKGFLQNNLNSHNTADSLQGFNQFGFGSQPQNIQKSPQSNIQSHNQNQSQWNQNQQKPSTQSHQSQHQGWINPNPIGGGYAQQTSHQNRPQNPHNPPNSNPNKSSHEKNYSQNYNSQNFNQNQNSQEHGYGKNDYQNQIVSNISNNTANESDPEKVQTETRTSITGNNPLRYIQPTGMGSIRGKR